MKKRIAILVTPLLLVGLPALQAHAQDAAAHKAWMDDAAMRLSTRCSACHDLHPEKR